LIRYFRELEILLDEARIDDAQLRKDHAMRYLDNDDYEIWDSLVEAQRPYSYGEFRRAVINSYPGAEATRKYNLRDVTQLTEKWRRDGIATTQALGEYYRDFPKHHELPHCSASDIGNGTTPDVRCRFSARPVE